MSQSFVMQIVSNDFKSNELSKLNCGCNAPIAGHHVMTFLKTKTKNGQKMYLLQSSYTAEETFMNLHRTPYFTALFDSSCTSWSSEDAMCFSMHVFFPFFFSSSPLLFFLCSGEACRTEPGRTRLGP